MAQPGTDRSSKRAQSVAQVESILNQPTSLLVHLARTGSLDEQRRLILESGSPSLLEAMAIPPPSPTTLIANNAQAADAAVLAESHPVMPVLLGQAFEPPFFTAQGQGLLALASIEPERRFQPIYTSIDDFSVSAALQQAESAPGSSSTPTAGRLTDEQISALAQQIKAWAIEQQTTAVTHQVDTSRDVAVSLASQAAQYQHHRHDDTPLDELSGHSQPFEHYVTEYRQQLQALASGYYSQLHTDAAKSLGLGLAHSTTVQAASTVPDGQAKLVQAAAAAAVAANALAANEMIARAEQQLPIADSSQLMGPKAGLSRLVVSPLELQGHDEEHQRLGQKSATTNQTMAASHSAAPTTGIGSATIPPAIKSTASDAERDQLLAYAHDLYCREPNNTSLLPLLHTLRAQHPRHLPVLLLISCVYYVRGDLNGSLVYNRQILDVDPNYVEAMSNIGTTLRAMGKWREAEDWWWRAVKIRPTYWDATENLLGVLCQTPPAEDEAGEDQKARLERAHALCVLVESRLFASNPDSNAKDKAARRPLKLPKSVSKAHVHRLLNFFYAKGNITSSLGLPIADALDEYVKGIEIAFSTSHRDSAPAIDLRSLLLGSTVISLSLSAVVQRDARSSAIFQATADTVGLVKRPDGSFDVSQLLSKTKVNAESVMATLLKHGGGIIPTTLLRPNTLPAFLASLLLDYRGVLPVLGHLDDTQASGRLRTTYQTLSTLLLTVAKIGQDALATPGSPVTSLHGIPLSASLLLPIYYLALALCPSPSTCNNLGILLSTINTSVQLQNEQGKALTMTGQQLALEYYRAGLLQDPKHAHLYTNYGSLLKDLGYLSQAIEMYKKAVEFNPSFDVALANLANAIKDNGQIQDSIPYYRRAVALNPHFPEAICGLVNALGGVCDWVGRGAAETDDAAVDDHGNLVQVGARDREERGKGYMRHITELIDTQLAAGGSYGTGGFASFGPIEAWLDVISLALTGAHDGLDQQAKTVWTGRLAPFYAASDERVSNEGSYLIRLVERLTRRIQHRWYLDRLEGSQTSSSPVDTRALEMYRRPLLPPSLSAVPVPTVLPFHTFTLPVSARQARLISHRTGIRISQSQLSQAWMPSTVFPPPARPSDRLRIGYVSSDLGNHPLSHLMQSVFGLHDRQRFAVFCYATSPSDKSSYRHKIEAEAEFFRDVSAMSTQQTLSTICEDGIHILINLSGYTKGARNEIFAARPCPVQMSYMGFAGTLSAGWCDYFIVDPVVSPPSLVSGNLWRQSQEGQTPGAPAQLPTDFEGDLDPEGSSDDFVYSEKLLYLPHTYFVTDHKQAWHEDDHPQTSMLSPEDAWTYEQVKRERMRKSVLPDLPEDCVVFANWNQLYKIDPFIFRIWLRILQRLPNSVLWLLRFPAGGESHLKTTAERWAGPDVARRIIFTDVAGKAEHVHRGRIADLFLDTTECNAHTTAADILYSGTPLLTLPRHRHKLCSRVAASIALATGRGKDMIVESAQAYEDSAVSLAQSLSWTQEKVPTHLFGLCQTDVYRHAQGKLNDLRRHLFLTRDSSPLFDTARWVKNVEKGYLTAWERWSDGTEFEDNPAWRDGPTRETGCIWVEDDLDGINDVVRKPFM